VAKEVSSSPCFYSLISFTHSPKMLERCGMRSSVCCSTPMSRHWGIGVRQRDLLSHALRDCSWWLHTVVSLAFLTWGTMHNCEARGPALTGYSLCKTTLPACADGNLHIWNDYAIAVVQNRSQSTDL